MRCWVEKAKAGDPEATEALVEALRPRISRMAAYYARCSGEECDDLLQEAWLGLLEAVRVVDLAIGTPEQYLLQRAKWRLLDAIKRARVRRCEQLGDEALEGIPSPDAPVGEACVAEFLGQLKLPQRRVVDCLLRGLTWREAGELLGCTSANVAYHVRQIRRQYEEWSGHQSVAARE
jgi:RNA polymerase sigma-70 factor (ECF subfamily)